MLCPEPATARKEPLPKNHRETPRENPLSLQSACLGVGDAVPPTAPSPRMAVSSEWDMGQAGQAGSITGKRDMRAFLPSSLPCGRIIVKIHKKRWILTGASS